MGISAADRALNETVGHYLADSKRIDVLEAGGGSRTAIVLPAVETVITTIDISPVQIAENTYATCKILGNLCTYSYAPESFDVIVCMEVLEHLEDPIAAVRRFVPAVRPGGLIVIGAPNPLSLAGLMTKFTPYYLHVLFYRYVHGNPNAGKPGYFPFPTTMHFSIAPDHLARAMTAAGLEIVYFNLYEGEKRDLLRKRALPAGILLDAVVWMLRAATGGRYRPELSDYHLIARKPAIA